MKKKFKLKKKIVIPLVILVVAGVAGAMAVQQANAKPQIHTVETYPATVHDLSNTINITGTVLSDAEEEVYNTLPYQIATVAVKVGDEVAAGDLLCQLDATELRATIAQTAATLESAKAKAEHSVAMAEKDLETALFNEEQDYNTQLLAAQSTVKSAENAVEKAEHALKMARDELDNAKDDIIRAEDETLITFDSIVDTRKQAVTNAEITLEGARQSLEDAEAQLRAVKMQEKETQVSREDAVTSAELNTDFSDQEIVLQKLQTDLAKTTITAPISGVVTAVYANEGATGTGLLFVIEDPDALKVNVNVKEYDIAKIEIGQRVLIKADGTGEEEFTGVVSKIAPTTLKDATGKVVDTTSAEFETEVAVDPGSKLRIGMNARTNIITEEKEQVLSIPVDAIIMDETGKQIVYIMDPQEDGTTVAKAVEIETGMETDFECEVTSSTPELQEGDAIILAADALAEGMLVQTADALQGALQEPGAPGNAAVSAQLA